MRANRAPAALPPLLSSGLGGTVRTLRGRIIVSRNMQYPCARGCAQVAGLAPHTGANHPAGRAAIFSSRFQIATQLVAMMAKTSAEPILA